MTNTIHAFNAELAVKYGLEESILIQHFIFWNGYYKTNHEKSAEVHFHNNQYWFYNSIQGWLKQYPYLTEAKIKRALSNLEGSGLISVGNFNQTAYDRTKWYSLNPLVNIVTPLAKITNEIANIPNGIKENHHPIPVANSVANSVAKPSATKVADVVEFNFDGFSEEEIEAIKDWIQYKKESEQTYKPTALKGLRNKLLNLKNKGQLISSINNSIGNNWAGLFEDKTITQTFTNQQQKQNSDDDSFSEASRRKFAAIYKDTGVIV